MRFPADIQLWRATVGGFNYADPPPDDILARLGLIVRYDNERGIWHYFEIDDTANRVNDLTLYQNAIDVNNRLDVWGRPVFGWYGILPRDEIEPRIGGKLYRRTGYDWRDLMTINEYNRAIVGTGVLPADRGYYDDTLGYLIDGRVAAAIDRTFQTYFKSDVSMFQAFSQTIGVALAIAGGLSAVGTLANGGSVFDLLPKPSEWIQKATDFINAPGPIETVSAPGATPMDDMIFDDGSFISDGIAYDAPPDEFYTVQDDTPSQWVTDDTQYQFQDDTAYGGSATDAPTVQTFDDGSTLVTDANGNVSATPASPNAYGSNSLIDKAINAAKANGDWLKYIKTAGGQLLKMIQRSNGTTAAVPVRLPNGQYAYQRPNGQVYASNSSGLYASSGNSIFDGFSSSLGGYAIPLIAGVGLLAVVMSGKRK